MLLSRYLHNQLHLSALEKAFIFIATILITVKYGYMRFKFQLQEVSCSVSLDDCKQS